MSGVHRRAAHSDAALALRGSKWYCEQHGLRATALVCSVSRGTQRGGRARGTCCERSRTSGARRLTHQRCVCNSASMAWLRARRMSLSCRQRNIRSICWTPVLQHMAPTTSRRACPCATIHCANALVSIVGTVMYAAAWPLICSVGLAASPRTTPSTMCRSLWYHSLWRNRQRRMRARRAAPAECRVTCA